MNLHKAQMRMVPTYDGKLVSEYHRGKKKEKRNKA